MPTGKINVAVSTVYVSLSADAIDCVEFVVAVEQGLSVLSGFAVGRPDGNEDYFFVHLGFDEVDDELRAVSVVVAFHPITSALDSEADYFLRQYRGHFIAGEEASAAGSLVESVHQEIAKRVEQGWLEP